MKRKYHIHKSLTDLPEYRAFCDKVGPDHLQLYENVDELTDTYPSDIVLCDDRNSLPQPGISGYRVSRPKDTVRFSTLAPFRYYYTVMNVLTGLLVIAFLVSAIAFGTSSYSDHILPWMIALAIVTGVLIVRPLNVSVMAILILTGMSFAYLFVFG